MKICHGVFEIAGQGCYAVDGLLKNGIEAKELLWYENAIGYMESNINVKSYNIVRQKSKFFKNILPFSKLLLDAIQYDCFHFHFAQSLLPFNCDLPFLKALGKKLFFEFHGSELRGVFNDIHYDYFNPDNPDRNILKKRIGKCLKYADGVILHDTELLPHLPLEYKKKVNIVPLKIDLENFKFPSSDNYHEKPMVVHAPSKRANKGTSEILKGLEPIMDKIQFVLVENLPIYDAKKFYEQADIIIDQIAIGTYGVFSIEAMALGKPVLSYVEENIRRSFPEELPIVNITPDNIAQKIMYLIEHPNLRKELGEKGYNYVHRYHDHIKNAKLLNEVYEGNWVKNGFDLL